MTPGAGSPRSAYGLSEGMRNPTRNSGREYGAQDASRLLSLWCLEKTTAAEAGTWPSVHKKLA
eukprot:scaffold688_cov365-Pinguiococcus_pyrenoidosus.AAC.2